MVQSKTFFFFLSFEPIGNDLLYSPYTAPTALTQSELLNPAPTLLTPTEYCQSICDEYGICGGLIKNHTVLRGKFGSHENVYSEIDELVWERDDARLKARIKGLKSRDCRDLKTKLASSGKCGRKLEMQTGILHAIKALQRSYFQ